MKKLALVFFSLSFMFLASNVNAQECDDIPLIKELQSVELEVEVNEGDCTFTVTAVGAEGECFDILPPTIIPQNFPAVMSMSGLAISPVGDNAYTVANASGCYTVLLFAEVTPACNSTCEGVVWPIGHTEVCVCN